MNTLCLKLDYCHQGIWPSALDGIKISSVRREAPTFSKGRRQLVLVKSSRFISKATLYMKVTSVGEIEKEKLMKKIIFFLYMT